MRTSIRVNQWQRTTGHVLTVKGVMDGKAHILRALYRDNKVLALKEWRRQPVRLAYDRLSAVDCRIVRQFMPIKAVPVLSERDDEMQERILKVVASMISQEVDALFST